MNSAPVYLLDNAAPEAQSRFWALESIFDEATFARVRRLGIRPGWRCLEIGAGGGSVARWLADQVSPGGSVLATDLDTRWLDAGGRPNLETTRHDVVADPLPESAYDLVHARLVLGHLRQRLAVLDRLISALRPGGILVLEEFTNLEGRGQPFLRAPANGDTASLQRVHDACTRFLEAGGVDFTYPWLLPNLLADRGLVGIGAEGDWRFCRGGTAGAQLMKANLEQLRQRLVERGLTVEADANGYVAAMKAPDALFTLPVLVRAWGLRAEKAS